MYIVLIAALRRLMLIILTINTIHLRSELCRLKCVVIIIIASIYSVHLLFGTYKDDCVSDVLIKNILRCLQLVPICMLGLDYALYVILKI